jgi:hypothetical protein
VQECFEKEQLSGVSLEEHQHVISVLDNREVTHWLRIGKLRRIEKMLKIVVFASINTYALFA